MPIRKPKPTSPGRRFVTYADYSELTKKEPEKSATLTPNGWVQCPHCRYVFRLVPRYWTGHKHRRRGGRIKVLPCDHPNRGWG